jgi:hypothetical protein
MSLSQSSANPTPKLNRAILAICRIMKNALASVAEAEVAACFINAQEACSLRHTLTTLGHN